MNLQLKTPAWDPAIPLLGAYAKKMRTPGPYDNKNACLHLGLCAGLQPIPLCSSCALQISLCKTKPPKNHKKNSSLLRHESILLRIPFASQEITRSHLSNTTSLVSLKALDILGVTVCPPPPFRKCVLYFKVTVSPTDPHCLIVSSLQLICALRVVTLNYPHSSPLVCSKTTFPQKCARKQGVPWTKESGKFCTSDTPKALCRVKGTEKPFLNKSIWFCFPNVLKTYMILESFF